MATVNSELVLNWMKKHYGEEHTKQEIAEALNISIPAVTGTINSLIKKGYAETSRTEDVVVSEATETKKAQVKTIKYHRLTAAGLEYDPVAEAEQKAAEKAAKKAAKTAE